MSETMKVILAIVTVGIALAALIINSNGNIRADMRGIRVDMRDIRTEVANNRVEIGNNRIEIGNNRIEINGLRTDVDGLRTEVDGLRTEVTKFGQGLQTLTEQVMHIEELIQGLLLPHRDTVARAEGEKS